MSQHPMPFDEAMERILAIANAAHLKNLVFLALSPNDDGETSVVTVHADSAANVTSMFHVVAQQFFQQFARHNGLPAEVSVAAMEALVVLAQEGYLARVEAGKRRIEKEIDLEFERLKRRPLSTQSRKDDE